ncbi:hypothetical protein B0H11DRAFT_1917756 [Mycena galericulata]|nr:hypothetical protein B0H11DRAFT_1917756 [Mycena galericulata]
MSPPTHSEITTRYTVDLGLSERAFVPIRPRSHGTVIRRRKRQSLRQSVAVKFAAHVQTVPTAGAEPQNCVGTYFEGAGDDLSVATAAVCGSYSGTFGTLLRQSCCDMAVAMFNGAAAALLRRSAALSFVGLCDTPYFLSQHFGSIQNFVLNNGCLGHISSMTQFNILFNFLGCMVAPAVGCGTPVVHHFPAVPFQAYWENSRNEFNCQRQCGLQMNPRVYSASQLRAALSQRQHSHPAAVCGNFVRPSLEFLYGSSAVLIP